MTCNFLQCLYFGLMHLPLLIRLRAKPHGGFLNSADELCVVGLRKWPLDKCVHLDTFY